MEQTHLICLTSLIKYECVKKHLLANDFHTSMALHCYLLSSLFSMALQSTTVENIPKKDYSLSIHVVSLNHIFSCLNFCSTESYRLSNFTYVVLLNLMEWKCSFLSPKLVFPSWTSTYISLLASCSLLSVFLALSVILQRRAHPNVYSAAVQKLQDTWKVAGSFLYWHSSKWSVWAAVLSPLPASTCEGCSLHSCAPQACTLAAAAEQLTESGVSVAGREHLPAGFPGR